MSTDIFIYLIITSFIYGFGQDFADLLDEHGLKWFKGSAIIIGVISGIAAGIRMILYAPTGAQEVAILLYWLVMNKLDYLNHQISAAIILLFSFWSFRSGILDFSLTMICFLTILAVNIIAKQIKKRYGDVWFLFMRRYISIIVISIIVGSILILLFHLFAMISVIASTLLFERF